MKRLGVFVLLPGKDAPESRTGLPQHLISSTHLCTCTQRGTTGTPHVWEQNVLPKSTTQCLMARTQTQTNHFRFPASVLTIRSLFLPLINKFDNYFMLSSIGHPTVATGGRSVDCQMSNGNCWLIVDQQTTNSLKWIWKLLFSKQTSNTHNKIFYSTTWVKRTFGLVNLVSTIFPWVYAPDML